MVILTKLMRNDFENILSAYNIGSYKKHKYIPWSLKNTLYLLQTTRGTYVLKIFETAPLEAILYQLRIMRIAEKHKVLVPRIIKTKSRKDFAIYFSKNLIIAKYVEGFHPKKLSSKLISQIAKQQAIFNKALKSFRLENKFNWGGDYHFKIMNFRAKKFLWFDGGKEEQKILQQLSYIDKKKLRRSAVHGDFDIVNLLVKKGKLASILDWDDAHEDYIVYDAACFIASAFVSEAKVHKKQIRLYLKEYQKVLKLNKEEIKAVYFFIKQRFIGSICWHINMLRKHSDIREGVIQVVLRIMEQYKNFDRISLEEFERFA